ncbi:MAG TPA: hypothetical protein VHQ97_08975 [Solirubrobacterales bacterium]|jgi:hypothetical protein|nr:hypothetical protein [Solirubrobacterales bacterium]
MKRLLLAAILAVLVLGVSSPLALAGGGNPSGTGPPSQSCQEIEGEGGTVPGHSSSSPGSPFNEPEINSPEGGTGGQHYSEKSQYDVACYHVSQNH